MSVPDPIEPAAKLCDTVWLARVSPDFTPRLNKRGKDKGRLHRESVRSASLLDHPLTIICCPQSLCRCCVHTEGLYEGRDAVDKDTNYSGRLGCAGCNACAGCERAKLAPGQLVLMIRDSSREGRMLPHHLSCAVKYLGTDFAPTAKAKCKADSTIIELGEPRLVVMSPQHNGEVAGQICKLHNAREFMAVLHRHVNLPIDSIKGYSQLSTALPEVALWVSDALKGQDGCPTPIRYRGKKLQPLKSFFAKTYEKDCGDCRKRSLASSAVSEGKCTKKQAKLTATSFGASSVTLTSSSVQL